jgi:hypothetical protein
MNLLSGPAHLKAARAEFDARTRGFAYRPATGDRKPALDDRRGSVP